MPKPKVSTLDVMNWLKGQAGYIPFLGVLGLIIWTTWAEPRVKKVVEDSTAETKVKVEKLENKMEHIQFENKQQLYLLKKLAGKQTVEDMEEETELFKPEGYEE